MVRPIGPSTTSRAQPPASTPTQRPRPALAHTRGDSLHRTDPVQHVLSQPITLKQMFDGICYIPLMIYRGIYHLYLAICSCCTTEDHSAEAAPLSGATAPAPIHTDYPYPTSDERAHIFYIINTLANYTLFNIPELRRRGKLIEHVHPLGFLASVVTDPTLLQDMRTLHANLLPFKWNNVSGSLIESIATQARNNNLSPHVASFALRTQKDRNVIEQYIHTQDWKEFVEYMIGVRRAPALHHTPPASPPHLPATGALPPASAVQPLPVPAASSVLATTSASSSSTSLILNSLAMTREQENDIAYLLSTIASNNVVALGLKTAWLKAAWTRLSYVHPLKLLDYIFSQKTGVDAALESMRLEQFLRNLETLREDNLKKGYFFADFADTLIAGSRHTTTAPYLDEFVQIHHLDREQIALLISENTKQSWTYLIETLMIANRRALEAAAARA